MMHFLAGVSVTIADAFRHFIAPLLRAIFGQIRWTPPPWLLGAVGSLLSWSGRAFNWLAARRAANPAGFWLTTFALLAFIIGGYAGWQWYEHLPQPYYLQVSVTRPGPTPLEPNAPPYPLDIQFSGSAARLGAKFRSTSTRVFGLVLATSAQSLTAHSNSGLRIF
jgi:hypothetical protein